MNNQISTTDTWIQGIALAILAALFALLVIVLGVYQFSHTDPYIESVLALKGNAQQGEAIFQMNCASCHGIYADGMVGPNLHHVSERKSSVGIINQVISGQTPPMPQFQPSPQEMADLLRYLEAL